VLNSRFIATVDRADSVETAKQIIADIRGEMPDATHHVYAFRIGSGNKITEGVSNAGEPSGTAGLPVMSVLRGSKLGDAVLVITRYFGGTKLGKGGLIHAYTEAAQTCLATLATVSKVPRVTIGIDVNYSLYEAIRRLIVQYDGMVSEEVFLSSVSIIAQMATGSVDPFTTALCEITNGTVKPIMLE
jgi:uncharacterized YigZ family protein